MADTIGARLVAAFEDYTSAKHDVDGHEARWADAADSGPHWLDDTYERKQNDRRLVEARARLVGLIDELFAKVDGHGEH